MTDGEAFFQAIIDNPDDDHVRLVYADWLEEQGQTARAEFIRLQCELASMSKDDPRFRPLTERELEMIRTYKDEWFGALRKRFSFWECRRGFWDEVRYTRADVFLEAADELFKAHPVQHTTLSGVNDVMADLANCPYLARLATFRIYYGEKMGNDGLQALINSPYLTRLRVLELRGCLISNKGAKIIAASPNLASLSELNLSSNSIHDSGARALAASPHLQNVKKLNLAGNPITESTVRELQAAHGGRVLLTYEEEF